MEENKIFCVTINLNDPLGLSAWLWDSISCSTPFLLVIMF